jgi:hypothetical protein
LADVQRPGRLVGLVFVACGVETDGLEHLGRSPRNVPIDTLLSLQAVTATAAARNG